MRKAKPQRQDLWHPGCLFHMTNRYPRKPKAPKIDRLAGILKRGLLAPASCPDGLVRSDLTIIAEGTAIPYDALVFLHRFGEMSYIYTMCEPGRFAVFVDPATPVITQEDMGQAWCVLCRDEVYVRDRVEVEKLTAIAVHPADAETVWAEFRGDFERLGIPLCDIAGNVIGKK